MVIKLLHTLQMKGLRYHSLCMIYSLMGINYYKLGDIFKAKECMLRIVSMQLKPYPKNNEEYALFYFFCALLYKSNKEYDSAEKYFRKALSTLECSAPRCQDIISKILSYAAPPLIVIF